MVEFTFKAAPQGFPINSEISLLVHLTFQVPYVTAHNHYISGICTKRIAMTMVGMFVIKSPFFL